MSFLQEIRTAVKHKDNRCLEALTLSICISYRCRREVNATWAVWLFMWFTKPLEMYSTSPSAWFDQLAVDWIWENNDRVTDILRLLIVFSFHLLEPLLEGHTHIVFTAQIYRSTQACRDIKMPEAYLIQSQKTQRGECEIRGQKGQRHARTWTTRGWCEK